MEEFSLAWVDLPFTAEVGLSFGLFSFCPLKGIILTGSVKRFFFEAHH